MCAGGITQTAPKIAPIALLFGLLFAPQAAAFLVIGDSISATPNSWPAVAQREYGAWVKNMSQSGRTLLGYELPPDLQRLDWHKEAVIFLGTNDALFPVEHKAFARKYVETLRALLERGYKVLVIYPPSMPGRDTQRVREAVGATCELFRKAGQAVRCFDPDTVGYYANTSDGVHPTKAMSRALAFEVLDRLRGWD